MTKASNDYYEAHGFPNGNQDKRSNGNGNKPYTHGKPNDGQPHGPPNVPLRCENCGLRNHHTSECRKPKGDQGIPAAWYVSNVTEWDTNEASVQCQEQTDHTKLLQCSK